MTRSLCVPTGAAVVAGAEGKCLLLPGLVALILLAGCEGGRVMLPTTDVDVRTEDEALCIVPVGAADNTAVPESLAVEEGG